MDWPRQCAVIIPCFNEEANIREIVHHLRASIPTVFVVDDGSTDGTARAAAVAGATVLRHGRNLGKGAALQTGWRQAAVAGFSWTLVMDGDGQHATGDMARFFERADSKPVEMVVGDRLHNPRGMPWIRLATNRWMTARISKLTGQAVADSQCGYRLIQLEALSRCWPDESRFEIESALLFNFHRASLRVEFVPVTVIYRRTPSKIRPLTDGWRWLRWWRRAAKRRPQALSGPGGQFASRNSPKSSRVRITPAQPESAIQPL